MLDDQTIKRIVRLCTAQSEFVPIHREQLTRSSFGRSVARDRALGRARAAAAQVISDVLAIARELKGATIDATLRMDPIELALAALIGQGMQPK